MVSVRPAAIGEAVAPAGNGSVGAPINLVLTTELDRQRDQIAEGHPVAIGALEIQRSRRLWVR